MTIAGKAIRRAGLSDLERIAQLEQACFGDSDGVFSRRQLARLLRNPNACWMIGTNGQAVSCWLAVSNGHARWARLYSLAVHPDLRGQGWGKRLMHAGLAWMQVNGLRVCRAEVKIDNHAARRLYANLGFEEAGRLPDYYGPRQDGLRLVMRTPESRNTTHTSAPARSAKRRARRRHASSPGKGTGGRLKGRP
ncbi:MAG: GNAT family N-acetyltransferase [Acidiferrobacterales bacterium]